MNSILITGSNRGIGLGLIKALVNSKNNPKRIIATCRNPLQAEELQSLAKNHKNISILTLEIQNYNSYKDFAKQVSDIVQNEGLNVLVNNAGINHKFLRIHNLEYENMLEAFNINCVGPVILAKELLPLLKQAANNNQQLSIGPQRAAIINISSILGSIFENNQGGYYPYRCSKAALNAATKSLSIDLKSQNIMAVSLHPGWVKTRMGGPKAPLEVDNASQSILTTITKLSSNHNGGFYSFEGNEIKW